jgi:hypothetical protein
MKIFTVKLVGDIAAGYGNENPENEIVGKNFDDIDEANEYFYSLFLDAIRGYASDFGTLGELVTESNDYLDATGTETIKIETVFSSDRNEIGRLTFEIIETKTPDDTFANRFETAAEYIAFYREKLASFESVFYDAGVDGDYENYREDIDAIIENAAATKYDENDNYKT